MANLASLLGVHTNTLGSYERGERLPDVDFLAKIALATNSSFGRLVNQRLKDSQDAMVLAAIESQGGTLDEENIRLIDAAVAAGDLSAGFDRPAAPASGFAMIPRFDIQASAGPGAFTDREQVVDYMAFRAEWVRRALGVDPRKLVLISAVGDSMEPTIRTGDLLLIDTAVDRIVDDAIYVVALDRDLIVKRVQKFFDGAVTVRSDNAAYVEQTLGPDEVDRITVAGRVRWIGRLV